MPVDYLTDILTQVIMKHHRVINSLEADLFLLSIQGVKMDVVPKNLNHLALVNKRNVTISKMYCQILNRVVKCFENVGLNDLAVCLLHVSKKLRF